MLKLQKASCQLPYVDSIDIHYKPPGSTFVRRGRNCQCFQMQGLSKVSSSIRSQDTSGSELTSASEEQNLTLTVARSKSKPNASPELLNRSKDRGEVHISTELLTDKGSEAYQTGLSTLQDSATRLTSIIPRSWQRHNEPTRSWPRSL